MRSRFLVRITIPGPVSIEHLYVRQPSGDSFWVLLYYQFGARILGYDGYDIVVNVGTGCPYMDTSAYLILEHKQDFLQISPAALAASLNRGGVHFWIHSSMRMNALGPCS